MDILNWYALNLHEGKVVEEKDPVTGIEFQMRILYENPQNGASILFCRYPRGYVKPLHHHTFGQGLYVLNGKMLANDRIYENGSFVWYPAGSVGTHGALPDSDCEFLAFSDGKGELMYDVKSETE